MGEQQKLDELLKEVAEGIEEQNRLKAKINELKTQAIEEAKSQEGKKEAMEKKLQQC